MSDDGYEIHSILEFGDKPAEGLWWVLSPAGKSPPIRAGAGSLVIKKDNVEYDESIVFSGGATPAGYLSDIVKLDLIHGEWQNLSNQNFQPRYEHGMCFDDKNNLMVFLGTGNEELKSQTLDGESWTKTRDLGIPARTVSQCAQHESRTFIWSGGCATGIVTDSNALYVIENGQTKKEKLSGEIPSARQEFAMCTDGNFLFIHGGLSSDGQKLNDLYKINLKTFRSKKCQIENDGSLTRAMHKMVIFEKNIFLFGGLTENDSISDDLFKLTPVEGSNRFTKSRIDFETKPTPRIAFNFHIINLPIRKSSPIPREIDTENPGTEPQITPVDDWKVTIDSQNVTLPQTGPDGPSSGHSRQPIEPGTLESMPVLLIHGGCDSEGEFFNDIFVSCIPN